MCGCEVLILISDFILFSGNEEEISTIDAFGVFGKGKFGSMSWLFCI